jgi:hypothetical protein
MTPTSDAAIRAENSSENDGDPIEVHVGLHRWVNDIE